MSGPRRKANAEGQQEMKRSSGDDCGADAAVPAINFGELADTQQSLHFLDDEGQRIRYLLSTNGCAVDPDDPRIEELSVR